MSFTSSVKIHYNLSTVFSLLTWWARTRNSAQLSPLVRLVVYLLYNKLYNKSTKNPQQILNNPQLFDKSTTNPQQIESMEYGFRLVHNKSISCTTNPQQIHNFTTIRTTCCTTIRQIHGESTTQIEPVEFEL
jgi:hypothetical protein